jgi:hypothetical protein
MNLKDKRTKRICAAAASAAVITAGGVVLATGASAGSTPTLAFTGPSTVTLLNGPGTKIVGDAVNHKVGNAALAKLAYGLRLTTPVSGQTNFTVVSAPGAAGAAKIPVVTTTNLNSSAPDGNTDWSTGATLDTSSGANSTTSYATDSLGNQRIFIAPDTVGDYTFEFWQDTDGTGGTAPTSGDDVSGLLTVHVKTPGATADTTTWAAGASAPATVAAGVKVPVSVDYSGLTGSDVRGGTVLADGLASLTKVAFNGNAAAALDGHNGTSGWILSGNGVANTPITSKVKFDALGAGTFGTYLAGSSAGVDSTSTTITAAATGTLAAGGGGTLVQVDDAGKAGTFNGRTDIKPGVSTVAYSATSGSAATGLAYFTVTPHVNASTSTLTCPATAPTLSADGTFVASYGDGVKVYSAPFTSNVATLKVTSSDTTGDCSYYTVDAAANGTTATQRRADYVVLKASALKAINTSTELVAPVGTASVTLKAALTDQLGTQVAPPTSDAQEAAVYVNGTLVSHPAVSGTVFSYTYTPSPAITSPGQTPFQFKYQGTNICPNVGDCDSATKNITWTSITPAGTVTLTSPIDGGTPTLETAGFVNSTYTVSGVVADAGNSPIVNKKVTLSGSEGVYFSTAADGSQPLTKTLDVLTGAGGQLGTAYAFYTKAGAATVTITADGKTSTAKVTVSAATNTAGWAVSANDASGISGSSVALTGKLVDAFGNPVSGVGVALDASPSTLGVLTQPGNTTADGSFSGSFAPTLGAKGDIAVTATITPATLSSKWAAAGVTVAASKATATAKLTVGPIVLTGPVSRVGAGIISLQGVSQPNTVVIIKGRTAGSTSGLVDVDTVTADAMGKFQSVQYITGTTTFVAEVTTGGTTLYSPSIVVAVTKPVVVVAKATVTGTAIGGGKVRFTIHGTPKKAAPVVVYVKSGSKWVKVASGTTASNGTKTLTSIKLKAGLKVFKVTYAPKGAKAATKTLPVRVK